MDIGAIPVLAAAGFGACLLALAICDLRSYTIPNTLCAGFLCLFVVSVPFAGGEISLLSHLCSFMAVLSVGFLAFRFGLFGGGDIKSWAAIAVWYDLSALPAQVLSVTLIGATLSIVLLALRRAVACQYVQHHVSGSRVPRLFRLGEPVPYGVAIAAGTAISAGHIDLFRFFPL